MHLNQLVDEVVNSVSNIKAVQSSCVMEVMKREDFTKEQKQLLVELLSPLDIAISDAQASFIIN